MNDLSYETFFSALSGNNRLAIIRYLQKNGKQSVNAIADGTGIEQSAVSHSLTKLLTCEFVHLEADGKHHYYTLNADTIAPLLALIDRHMSKYCEGTCTSCRKTPNDTAVRT